jgi:hypothetical protein
LVKAGKYCNLDFGLEGRQKMEAKQFFEHPSFQFKFGPEKKLIIGWENPLGSKKKV